MGKINIVQLYLIMMIMMMIMIVIVFMIIRILIIVVIVLMMAIINFTRVNRPILDLSFAEVFRFKDYTFHDSDQMVEKCSSKNFEGNCLIWH